MAVSPSVINKIKWVLFRKTEPTTTSGILWAKPEGEKFAFYVYDDGTWKSIEDGTGIIMPEISTSISAFDNDAGYLTAVDLSGYSTTEEMNAAIQTALAPYYQKPQAGIPVSDLALGMDNVPTSGSDNFVKSGGVYSALQDKQDKQLVIEIDYTDTTLPSGTYNSIITALAAGKGVIIELTDEDSVIHNLPLTYNGVNDDGLLLFSCVAGGIDFGVEVATNNNILVYKSNQVTSVNGQTGDVVLSIPDVSTKQDVIDSSHKLSADLVDDTNTTNKFTNATEKQAWNNEQDALVSGTNIKTINNESVLGSGNINIVTELPSNLAYTSNDNGEGIIPSDGIRAVTVPSAAAMTISPDVVTVIDGAVGTAAITLQVPQDNLAHVWDILMTTDSTVAITFAMSNSATILTPSGFSIGASKAVEISVIGVGTKYYLRYGEFA